MTISIAFTGKIANFSAPMKASGSKQVAARYVTALFDVSEGAHDKIEKDLKALDNVIKNSRELATVLSSPLLSRLQQEKAIAAVLAAMKAEPATRKFMALLARQKRLPLLPEIIALFMDKLSSARGEVKAEAVSAAKLSAGEETALAKALSKALGRGVALQAREDSKLLGGLVVKIGGVRLDASLAGKLRRLGLILRAA